MKTEIKEKWLTALRSGTYKQGREALTDGERFCCLGVLCDVVKDDLGLSWERKDGDYYMEEDKIFLPFKVAIYADFPFCSPKVYLDGASSPTSLAVLNDNEGFTFAELADLIEAQL